ncbi:hypothetical protein MHO82_01040 [Vibrio sp. Of7-15]|nr:hypothetical protein [Vibrio sp. Of7-15]
MELVEEKVRNLSYVDEIKEKNIISFKDRINEINIIENIVFHKLSTNEKVIREIEARSESIKLEITKSKRRAIDLMYYIKSCEELLCKDLSFFSIKLNEYGKSFVNLSGVVINIDNGINYYSDNKEIIKIKLNYYFKGIKELLYEDNQGEVKRKKILIDYKKFIKKEKFFEKFVDCKLKGIVHYFNREVKKEDFFQGESYIESFDEYFSDIIKRLNGLKEETIFEKNSLDNKMIKIKDELSSIDCKIIDISNKLNSSVNLLNYYDMKILNISLSLFNRTSFNKNKNEIIKKLKFEEEARKLISLAQEKQDDLSSWIDRLKESKILEKSNFILWVDTFNLGYPTLLVSIAYVYGFVNYLFFFDVNFFEWYRYISQEDVFLFSFTSIFFYIILIIFYFLYVLVRRLVRSIFFTPPGYGVKSKRTSKKITNPKKVLNIFFFICMTFLVWIGLDWIGLEIQNEIMPEFNEVVYTNWNDKYKLISIFSGYYLVDELDSTEINVNSMTRKWIPIKNVNCISKNKYDDCKSINSSKQNLTNNNSFYVFYNKENINDGRDFLGDYIRCYDKAKNGEPGSYYLEASFENNSDNVVLEYSLIIDRDFISFDITKDFYYKDKIGDVSEVTIFFDKREVDINSKKSVFGIDMGEINTDMKKNAIGKYIKRRYDDYIERYGYEQIDVFVSGHASIDHAYLRNIELSHERMDYVIGLTNSDKKYIIRLPLTELYPQYAIKPENQRAAIIVACKKR